MSCIKRSRVKFEEGTGEGLGRSCRGLEPGRLGNHPREGLLRIKRKEFRTYKARAV